MKEEEIIKVIQSAIRNIVYNDDVLTLDTSVKFGNITADIIIKSGKRNLAVIEVKNRQEFENIRRRFETNYYFLFKVRYFVYTDGETFIIYDRLENSNEYKTVKIDGFIKQLRANRITQLNKLKKDAINIIEDKIKLYSKEGSTLLSLLKNASLSTDEIKISSDYTLYFYNSKEDERSFENMFFKLLLTNDVPEVIYRYTSFYRAFDILNTGKIAMHGLPGMNDTTEPNYVDNYINSTEDKVWEMADESKKAINRRFIMSCTTLKDDLMQWRLYGDDGRGSCISFKLNKNLIASEKFFIGRVKYANTDRKHPELELIKEIISEIRRRTFLDFRFVLLYAWKHFFKPKEYEYEQEVRVLYIHKRPREKKWILAEPYSIVNPMVLFDLSQNDFLLKVSSVMLGCKGPERALNKSQLEQMLSEKGSKIAIEESKLNIYR